VSRAAKTPAQGAVGIAPALLGGFPDIVFSSNKIQRNIENHDVSPRNIPISCFFSVSKYILITKIKRKGTSFLNTLSL
jgi:hypothetical protein